jgi:hypothetical protein
MDAGAWGRELAGWGPRALTESGSRPPANRTEKELAGDTVSSAKLPVALRGDAGLLGVVCRWLQMANCGSPQDRASKLLEGVLATENPSVTQRPSWGCTGYFCSQKGKWIL